MSFENIMQEFKQFLIDIFQPSVQEYFQFYGREKFDKWEHNCCRQSSLILNWFLRQVLLNNNSGYLEIQSWEGCFSELKGGVMIRYDHAWVYCVHEDPSKNLLIDLSRHHKPPLFYFTAFNQYPRHFPIYQHMHLLRKERLDTVQTWNSKEYFSEKTLSQIGTALSRYLQRQSIPDTANAV